ncbi:DUF7373 family lipoprotein [Nocardia jinanensis]|uniref:Lipoprotein n=1 Tax=Nocardia jinanensis TaxID=382504 RepID=A0A917RYT7_9NOCA|nr:hypothetical protein [Nocardia jinanensis]GGL44587.1 hypothetical protein GCM10011588_69120 [Nocardia jinanensis]
MVRISRAGTVTAVVALVAAALSGCGSLAGTAVPGEIDVRTLAVGDFPVEKFSYPGDAGDYGPILEGIRMSESVVTSDQIDPALKYGRGSKVLPDPATAIDFLANVSEPVLKNRKLVVGYAVSGADRDDPEGQTRPESGATAITVVALRFPDTTAATKAAKELEDADINVSRDNRRLKSDEYPDALVHWRPGIANIGAFLAHDEFVISLFVQRPKADSSDLVSWVDKTLTAQLAQLGRFRPTPIADIADLPVDPENMLSRVVVADRKGQVPDPDKFAVYGRNHLIDSADDQPTRARLLDESGFESAAYADGSSVARVRDPAGAPILVDGFIESAGEAYDPYPAVAGVPGAKCLRLNDEGDPQHQYRFRCFVPYKRYVGVVSSDNETEVEQKTAAQYALLANSL